MTEKARDWTAEGYGAFPNGEQSVMEGEPGMSLRDWFAGQALAGIMANPNVKNVADDDVVKAAYTHADNMLHQRQI